jgi:predicted PurR-regulated permease PerM
MARSHLAKPLNSRLVQAAAAIIIIFAMRYTKEVLVPIALAVLFAFALAPLVHRLERRKLGRVPSVLVVVLLAFAVIGVIGYVVANQVRDLTENLPQYTDRLETYIHKFKGHGGVLSKLSQTAKKVASDIAATQPVTQPAAAASASGTGSSGARPLGGDHPAGAADGQIVKVEVVPPTPPILETLYASFGPLIEILATGFIVVVLCIFMLLGREDLRDRVIRLMGQNQLNVTTQAMDDAATRVSRYLLAQAALNGSYGVLVALGLFFIGVPNFVLWGLLAALLRFIPYVGPWLGATIPCLLSLVTLGGHRFLVTVGMYVTLEIIVSSFVEPWLYGSHTGVSSIAILIAAIFWAWVWGGVGLLLATPLTVLLVVLGKYVPQLEFLGVLLGDEPVFDPPTRYYQRLLASDQEEASELIEEYAKEMPVEQIHEQVLIPALALAHRDRYRGKVDEDRMAFIRDSMVEEIEELAELSPPSAKPTVATAKELEATGTGAAAPAPGTAEAQIVLPAGIGGAENVQILCLPARDPSDEIAGMMFAQVLQRNGFKAEAVSVTALASEIIDLVECKRADIVVISALPPAEITHARYLCKRLHLRFPELRIVIGLWTSKADLEKAKKRIACHETDAVVSDFASAIHAVCQLVHPLLLAKEAESKEKQERQLEEAQRHAKPAKVGANAEAKWKEDEEEKRRATAGVEPPAKTPP